MELKNPEVIKLEKINELIDSMDAKYFLRITKAMKKKAACDIPNEEKQLLSKVYEAIHLLLRYQELSKEITYIRNLNKKQYEQRNISKSGSN
jgi:hypothetical protein